MSWCVACPMLMLCRSSSPVQAAGCPGKSAWASCRSTPRGGESSHLSPPAQRRGQGGYPFGPYPTRRSALASSAYSVIAYAALRREYAGVTYRNQPLDMVVAALVGWLIRRLVPILVGSLRTGEAAYHSGAPSHIESVSWPCHRCHGVVRNTSAECGPMDDSSLRGLQHGHSIPLIHGHL